MSTLDENIEIESLISNFRTINLRNEHKASITNEKREKLRILCQNVKSINDPYKKEYFKYILHKDKIDILILTETWEEPNCLYGIERTFSKFKTIKSTGTMESHKGKGIAVIIGYPLAQHVISYTCIQGRLIRIILRHRKKHAISLYAIQAPTAPYGAGAEETFQFNKQLVLLLNEDRSKGRRNIICGDLNSYPDKNFDYTGPGNGQSPSRIISSLQFYGLIDIYRVFNPQEVVATFRNNIVSTRLDQFWISPQVVGDVKGTKIMPFEDTVSDHSTIILEVLWPYKKCKSTKFEKTIWNNKDEKKRVQWPMAAEKMCKTH